MVISTGDFIVICIYAFVMLYLLAKLFDPNTPDKPKTVEQEEDESRVIIGSIPQHNPGLTVGDSFGFYEPFDVNLDPASEAIAALSR